MKLPYDKLRITAEEIVEAVDYSLYKSWLEESSDEFDSIVMILRAFEYEVMKASEK